MYFVVVVAFMLVLPIASIVIDCTAHPARTPLAATGTWFTFWAVGVRLAVAGLRQIVQPAYTARVILGLQGDEPLLVVRELGFANLSIATVALCSVMVPAFVPAGALAGGIFFTLAGINHIRRPHRNAKEIAAMSTDLIVGVILLVYLAGVLIGS